MAGNSSDCNFFTLNFGKYGSGQSEMNCQKTLKLFRKDNLNKIIFAHLNMNCIRNKFNCLSEQVKGNIDILLILENKIDDSFPYGHFIINGFNPTDRLDHNYHGGT